MLEPKNKMYYRGFLYGSRKGAQTPIEHTQNRRHYSDPSQQVKVSPYIRDVLLGLPDRQPYLAYHKWKKNIAGDSGWRWTVHHSQIFITDVDDRPIINFGMLTNVDRELVTDGNRRVYKYSRPYPWIREDDGNYKNNPYRISESYSPNPVPTSGLLIRLNLALTLQKCGTSYSLLFNNCQSFARLFMQHHHSKHFRHPFHP